MSWSDRQRIDDWLEEEKDRLYAQHQIWAEVDENRFTAMMDKKPELHYGRDFIEQPLIQPPFIIAPFFPAGGLCLMHGKRGLGKTMLAMTLTKSIATGTPFLDRYEVQQGTVVYIQLDMVDSVFQDRLKKAGDFYDCEGWYTLVGVASIGRANAQTKWVQDIAAVQPSLIIIDTLRKAHAWSENDSDSAGRFYAKLRELFGYTAVMMLHHDRKSSESTEMFSSESFRGSGAWLDDVDLGLHLKKSRKDGMTLEFSKVRTCPEIDPIQIEIVEDTMSIRPIDGERSKASIARASARSFIAANWDAHQEEVYNHLINSGFDKPTSSRAAKEAMP